jgi:hypothetical protein
MCTYFNDFEANSPNCVSDYSLWWADAPAVELTEVHARYKFQLISATNSDKVQIWLEDEVIDSTQAANAYLIKSVEVGQYAGTSVDGARSQDIGLTVDPEEPYIIRSQGAYVFDFWHPSHANASMHLESNSGGRAQVVTSFTGQVQTRLLSGSSATSTLARLIISAAQRQKVTRLYL